MSHVDLLEGDFTVDKGNLKAKLFPFTINHLLGKDGFH